MGKEGGIMPLLSARDQDYLRKRFAEELVDPVTITLYTQRLAQLQLPGYECATCREANELYSELAQLSEKVKLEVVDFLQAQAEARTAGVTDIPTAVFSGKNAGTVRYVGLPAGYEFAVLIEDLADLSRGTTRLTPLSRETLAKLPAPAHIKVFVTPT